MTLNMLDENYEHARFSYTYYTDINEN